MCCLFNLAINRLLLTVWTPPHVSTGRVFFYYCYCKMWHDIQFVYMTSRHEGRALWGSQGVYSLKIDKNSIKSNAHRGGSSSHCRRHLAWLFSALQLILSKCKLKKNVPNGFRARLNFGLAEGLNEFYRNVRGIIGKHSETIVITFQPVTFIIIIPLFRHGNFWLLLITAAVEEPRNMQQVVFFPCFDVLSSVSPGVRCLICSVVTGNAWVVCMPFRGGP